MALTPFHSVPKTRFLIQLAGPLAGVFLLGIGVMGWCADPETFRPIPLKNSTGEIEWPLGLDGPAHGGLKHWRTIGYFATHVPEVCWGDNAVNDFQRRQCAEFWERLSAGAGLSLLPFMLTFFAWILASGSLERVYRLGRKRVADAKPIGKAVVTSPAEAPGDRFSWMYCLRPIGVQLPDGKQIKVYIPQDAAIPLPGQAMLVYAPFESLGEARHLGLFYAPHVAVVSGVRRA